MINVLSLTAWLQGENIVMIMTLLLISKPFSVQYLAEVIIIRQILLAMTTMYHGSKSQSQSADIRNILMIRSSLGIKVEL